MEFSGGTWHCQSCPPTEAVREQWQAEQLQKMSEMVNRLPPPG